MSKDHNDDVQRLLVHFKRGLLRESPSSSKLLHVLLLKMCLEMLSLKWVYSNCVAYQALEITEEDGHLVLMKDHPLPLVPLLEP